MTLIHLKRHAPEAQSRETCSLCGARRTSDTKDHLLAGTPGTPTHNDVVCEACGTTLDQAVRKFGGDLKVTVEEAQREASDREITLPNR
jgi:hypothetical protein